MHFAAAMHTLTCCCVCLQVTNRDLSVAVLRKFLPQLSQELADGTLKRKFKTMAPRQQNGGDSGAAQVGQVSLRKGMASLALIVQLLVYARLRLQTVLHDLQSMAQQGVHTFFPFLLHCVRQDTAHLLCLADYGKAGNGRKYAEYGKSVAYGSTVFLSSHLAECKSPDMFVSTARKWLHYCPAGML